MKIACLEIYMMQWCESVSEGVLYVFVIFTFLQHFLENSTKMATPMDCFFCRKTKTSTETGTTTGTQVWFFSCPTRTHIAREKASY